MTPEQKIEERFVQEAGQQVLEALSDVRGIIPRRCRDHDRAYSECIDEDTGCTVEDTDPYEGALLTSFVLVAEFFVPKADPLESQYESGSFRAPGQGRTVTLGLLAQAADIL